MDVTPSPPSEGCLLLASRLDCSEVRPSVGPQNSPFTSLPPVPGLYTSLQLGGPGAGRYPDEGQAVGVREVVQGHGCGSSQ